MLHLLLGTGNLALIESPDPAPTNEGGPADDGRGIDGVSAAELFIDFDAYGGATQPG